jgi:hypothetical protein
MVDKKKPQQLTVKEAKLVKGIAEGKTKRQAASEAYDVKNINTAGALASVTLRKPHVQEALQQALEEKGLTPSSVVDVVADAMKAEKVVIIGKDEDAFADVQPDHSIRLSAAKMAANFMGLNQQPQGGTTVNNFNFGNKVKPRKYIDAED